MVSRGRRCLFSFLISSAFLLSIAHGDNSTTMQPTQPTTALAYCTSNPCQNGATCNDTPNMCDCAPGYSGDTCEIVNECVIMEPCQNGGTCTDNNNVDTGYSCACANGYSGDNCEKEDECVTLNPCQNGGSCTDEDMGYSCTCAAGYTGANCTTGTVYASTSVKLSFFIS
nr:delta-like protein D [Lytechinus pictus]